MTSEHVRIVLCGGPRCTKNGSALNKKAFERELKKHQIEKNVELKVIGCLRVCDMGPMVFVFNPEGTCYNHVKPEDVPEIVSEHILKGQIVKRIEFEYRNSGYEKAVPGFYNHKQRVEITVNQLQELKEN